MFSYTHYVPILKLKMGEVNALKELEVGRKKCLTPFFEITPIPWDYDNDQLSKTLEEHVLKVPANIEKCWGEESFFLDFKYVEEDVVAGSSKPMTTTYERIGAAGGNVVPVTGINRDEKFQRIIEDVVHTTKQGLCLRLEGTDFDEDTYGDAMIELIRSINVRPEDVDLMIDLNQIPKSGLTPFMVGLKSIIRFLPDINEWRSLTVAASAFPDSMSTFGSNTASKTPRSEWEMWNGLVNPSTKIKRMPSFGDYGIASPPPFEMDPRLMSLGAKIKYTLEEEWLIVKGVGIKTRGYKQFHDLAAYLARRKEFYGSDFSWGDRRIEECAKKRCGTGSQTTWVSVGMNHHFAVVCDQIAKMIALAEA